MVNACNLSVSNLEVDEGTDAKNWLFWKDPETRKDWRCDEMRKIDRGWDDWMISPTQWIWVWINLRSCDGVGSLACCSPWGRKESRLSWATELNWGYLTAVPLDPETCELKRKVICPIHTTYTVTHRDKITVIYSPPKRGSNRRQGLPRWH